MAHKIVVASLKGGIGKTTTSINIADNLMNAGKRVLFIDTDPHRHSTNAYRAKYLNVPTLDDIFRKGFKAEDCIQTTSFGDIIPGDDALFDANTSIPAGPRMYRYIQKSLANVENEYDYIIIDTPTEYGILLGNALEIADSVIIPVVCNGFGVQSMVDLAKHIEEFKEDNENINVLGILKVMYKRNQLLTKDIENNVLPQLARDMNTKVFKNTIRECVKCEEAATLGERLSEYAPHSTTALDYRDLVDEILEDLNDLQ